MPINGARVPRRIGAPAGQPVGVFSPSLHARAKAFHEVRYGADCDCLEEGTYPCEACAREIQELMELLDVVAREAIRITSQAWDRLG